jgi:hypothetical protein
MYLCIQSDAEAIEEILSEAHEYYKELAGVKYWDAQDYYEKTCSSTFIDPSELAETIFNLGLSLTDEDLYWVAQLYLSVELPPNFTKSW